MFGFLGDIAKGIGSIVGTAVGSIVGIPLNIIALTLNITKEMAQEAIDAGCKTYEEIKEFFDLK